MSDPHYCSDDKILDALAIINPEHENPNAPVFRPYLDKQEFLCCRFNQHLLVSVSDTHALNQSAYKDNRKSSKDKRICPGGVHTNIAELDMCKHPGTREVSIRGLWIDPLTNINARTKKRCGLNDRSSSRDLKQLTKWIRTLLPHATLTCPNGGGEL